MTDVKQAHKVPRFYLESFVSAKPAGQVWSYDKETNKRWSTIPNETATQGYFYAVKKPDGSKDLTIENYLSEVETKAKAGYEMLLGGGIPQGQVRADFATFVAMQFVRTPTMRQLWAETYSNALQDKAQQTISDTEAFNEFMEKLASESGGTKYSLEDKERIRQGMLDPSKFIFRVPQEMTIPVLLEADTMMQAVYDMNWSVGRAAADYFITSDNPVAAYGQEEVIKSEKSMKTVHFHEKSFFDFPLTPELILIMSWKKMREKISVTAERVALANQDRAIRCHRFLYSHVADDNIGQLLVSHKDTKWGLQSDEDPNLKRSKVEIERI